jgi:hypothetical protein
MRTYFRGTICPDCRQAPKKNPFELRWECACEGKNWPLDCGQRGTPEEHSELKNAGFEITSDGADVYYVGPLGHIVWLFVDSTWRCAPESQHQSLETYLEYMKSVPVL